MHSDEQFDQSESIAPAEVFPSVGRRESSSDFAPQVIQ